MKNSLLVTTAACCAIGAASTAHAQSAAAPSPNAATAPVGLEEIVVTAQKRPETLQKVPISVDAVTGSSLQEQKITNVQDLTTIVSGLEYEASTTGVSPYIRGFGINSGLAGNEPPVTTYVDGVYLPSLSGSIFSLSNIDRIEVLKGPQGTLFGRNAAAGALNIITRTPQQTPSIDLMGGYANYNTASGGFYGTTGLASNLAADLSVAGFKQMDGWGHNLFNGSPAFLNNNINARTKLLWTPTQDTTITVAADYDKTREDAGVALTAIPGTQKAPYTNYPTGSFYDTDDVQNQYRVAKQGGGSLHIVQDLSWATITSITSGRHLSSQADEDGTVLPIPYVTYLFNIDETTYTEELNIQSPSKSDYKWIAGFFYYNDTSGYSPFTTEGTSSGQGPNGQSIFYGTQKTDSYAGYGQLTAPLWVDNAHATLGLRYTEDIHRLTTAYTEALTSAP
jgi:iron complex outermembrane receptor protein